MANVQLLGYQDVVLHLRDVLKGDASEGSQRAIRRAAISAFRELVQCRDWSYLRSPYSIELNAPYSTGTCTYTASTRALTLATGTWPTWAAAGSVRIDNCTYEVYSRDSDSVLTLEAANCPVADIAAGTTYVIYQNQYTLPVNFRRIFRPENEDNWQPLQYIPPTEWMRLDRISGSSGDPQYFTIFGDPNNLGTQVLSLWPYPSSNKSLKFMYSRYPTDLAFSGEETASTQGTVASTATSTSITGTSTGFLASHVGSLIRFSSSSTAVEGEAGLNPFVEQHVIASRASTTAITTDVAMTNTLSGVAYCITSPIDIAPHMIEAYLRGCERQLSILKGTNQANAESQYRQALMLAFEGDANFELERTAYESQSPSSAAYSITFP